MIQDTRGRYQSEGTWEPFRNEAADGYDTIQWAAQQPWSNGKIATEGGSYLGHVQWRAASLAPPNLVTIFPMVASTSIYHNWAYMGGAFRLSFNYGWGAVRMPARIMLPQYWHDASYAPEELKYETILWHLPLNRGDLGSSNQPVPHYRDWLKHRATTTTGAPSATKNISLTSRSRLILPAGGLTSFSPAPSTGLPDCAPAEDRTSPGGNRR